MTAKARARREAAAGDTITHRGRACSVLNDQELAELVHATVAAACDQARAEVVAAVEAAKFNINWCGEHIEVVATAVLSDPAASLAAVDDPGVPR